MKHALARLSPYWAELLTQSERDAWNLYGANVAMTTVLGQTFHLTGQNHFLRANTPRIQSGISVLETAPTNFDLGTFTAPSNLAATDSPPTIQLDITLADAWASGAGGHMLIWEGRPTGPGNDFFGGPYRYLDRLDGPVSPPIPTQTFGTVWGLSAGNLLWVQTRVIQIDGRLSLPVVIGPTTVT